MDYSSRRRTRSQTKTNGEDLSNGTQKQKNDGIQNGVHQSNGVKITNGSTVLLHQSRPAESMAYGILFRILMPIFLMVTSPNLVILLWYTAAKCNGSIIILFETLSKGGVFDGLFKIWSEIHIASMLSVYVLLAYIIFAMFLQVFVPGPQVEGPVTPKGNTPVYRDNGFSCYLITLVAFGLVTYILKQNGLSPTVVYDHFDDFLGTLTVFSMILCALLYVKGIVAPSSTDCGSSGNPIFDYYWGTELYPRIFGVDIKVFTNCRFGMTVWPLLCLIFSIKSYELYGFVDSIWVSCILQMIYFTKFFWWESGYMRTIDIMVDRAGFYICWGCMVYIPGLYASVCMFLVNQPVRLGPVLSTIFLVCGVASIIINFWADHQKQIVRNTNGNCKIWGKKPVVIKAKYGLENGEIRESLLLVSGFWGVARHFHYVPELMLTFFWSVPGLGSCGLVYSYFIWLCLLLSHRTFRDDTKCGNKYGHYWKEYCKKVPYKMIPGIF